MERKVFLDNVVVLVIHPSYLDFSFVEVLNSSSRQNHAVADSSISISAAPAVASLLWTYLLFHDYLLLMNSMGCSFSLVFVYLGLTARARTCLW